MVKITQVFNRSKHLIPLKKLIALEKHDLIAVGTLAVLVALAGLAPPIAMQTFVNTVAMGGVRQSLVVVSIILGVLLVFSGSLQITERYVIRTAIETATKTKKLDIAFQDHHNSIELMNRFFEIVAMRSSVDFLLTDGFVSVLRVTVGSVVLLFYSPYFLIAELIMLSMLWFIISVLGNDAIEAAVDQSSPKYDVVVFLTSAVRNLHASKFAVDCNYGDQQIDELANDYLAKRARYFDILITQDIAGRLVFALGGASMVGFGAWLVMDGDINLGQFVASELIIFGILSANMQLTLLLQAFYNMLAAWDKLSGLQDFPEEKSGTHTVPMQSSACVDFNQVSFGFDQQDQIIKNLTFSLPSGSSNAIIGKPSSGKSILVDLITGLRSPVSGVVMINGVDLRDANMEALRAHISLVKNIELFETTILDNLRLSNKDITVESLNNVLRSLGLFKAVIQLKDGLETKLSITGLPLTNHQLRVLMIARAVIHKPVLVIVDELLDDLDEVEWKPVLEHLFAGLNQWTLLILTNHQSIASQCQHVITLKSRHEI